VPGLRSQRDGAPFYEPGLRRLLAVVRMQRARAGVALARAARGQDPAELVRDGGRAGKARATVAAVYETSEKGGSTHDQRAAAALLSRP
jgi:hypothetical protein